MLQGLRTVIYPAADLAKATAWYTEAIGHGPYFNQPFYVGFTVGGYELGLDPHLAPGPKTAAGPLAYWGVADIETERARLLKLGADALGDIQDVGEGIRVATVIDPFGNPLGLILNPHFKLPDAK